MKGRFRTSSNAGDVGLHVIHVLISPPEDLEEISARVLKVNRLTERALFRMFHRTFKGDLPSLQLGYDLIEPAARNAESVTKTMRAAVLIFRRHRHEIPRHHQGEEIVL